MPGFLLFWLYTDLHTSWPKTAQRRRRAARHPPALPSCPHTLTAEAPQPDASWQNHSFFPTLIFCVTCYIHRTKFFARCTPLPSCSSPLFLLFNGPHRFWQLVRPAGLSSSPVGLLWWQGSSQGLETEGLVGKALLFLLPNSSRQGRQDPAHPKRLPELLWACRQTSHCRSPLSHQGPSKAI